MLLSYLAMFLILPFSTAALPKGQSADFIQMANTALVLAILGLMIFTIGRIGAETYRNIAARTFK